MNYNRLLCIPLAAALTTAAACGSNQTSTRAQPNRAPTVDRVVTQSDELEPKGTTTLTAVAADPDLDSPSKDAGMSGDTGADAGPTVQPGPSELSYKWEVDNEDWSIEGEGPQVTLKAPDQYDSAVQVTVTATDAEGASSEPVTSEEISVGLNRDPRVTSLTADPNPVEPRGKITLKAEATDPNDDEVSFSWSAPSDWTLSSDSGQQVELTAPDREDAFGQVVVEVADGYGGGDRSSLQVQTSDNLPPNISLMNASPPQVEPGGKTTVEVQVNDPEGDDLSYKWSAPSGWSVNGSGDQVEVTAPDKYGKNAKITVEVTDARDNTATGSVVVSTTTNDGPAVSGLTAKPPVVDRGGTIAMSVQASDPNGDSLSYSWSVSNQKWSLSENGDKADLTAPDEPDQSTVVRVEVSDPSGETVTASRLVSTVSNNPPAIGSITVSPAQAEPGGVLQVKSAATDPDGDKLTYTWSAPSGWTQSGSDADITLKAPNKYGATGTLQLTVEDAFGAKASGSRTVSTEVNRPPTVSQVTANPVVVPKKGTSTLTATASDPNGDSLSYSWSVPSGWSKSGSGKQIDVTAPDTYGVTATFTVTVSDGNGAKGTGSVTVQTEQNQKPVIVSLTATKNTLNPKEKTTVEVTAGEPDGEPLSYSWNLSQGWSGSSNKKTIEVTAPDKYGTTGTVEAVVSDGTDSVSRKITLETVKNKPPSVDKLTVKPTKILQNGEATATVKASDPLGDTLGYTWSVTGQAWNIKGSGDTVKVQAPNKGGETAEVKVVVDDGHGGSDSAKQKVETTSCPTNKGNCDRKLKNKCEVDLLSNANHCGGCGNACSGSKVCSSGTCTQLRTKVALCGNSDRDIGQFIPKGKGLKKVSSCSFDAKTQAMLISRSGAGNVDAGKLKSYLNNGGVVLTEFRNSDEIFNKAFGTNVSQGPKYPGCSDRIPGDQQFNPKDPFWKAPNNDFNKLPTGNQTGCGYDVSKFPKITPLVGPGNGVVAVAYRNLGNGRLWLTDFDWQDDSFSLNETVDLMKYMVTHRR